LIPLVPDEILYGKMDPKLEEKASIGIGPLVLALAKTFHWAGLYGPDHAVLAKRVSEVHNALLSRLPLEPDGHLLFGIARDKVLYQNEFLGEGQDLVARLTENLYLRQVATVGFDGRVTPEGLLALLRYLNTPQSSAGNLPVSLQLQGTPLAQAHGGQGETGEGRGPGRRAVASSALRRLC
jgi:hypothetical protein